MGEENKEIQDKSGIYAFRNKTDGRVYVGQTKHIRTRKKQHERGDTSNSRRFHNAMNKHGAEAFEFTVLEYCSEELLDEREVYWISKLNSLYPNGYNLASGGGAFRTHHPETRKKFSENMKKKYAEGKHIFNSEDFQLEQSRRQKELASKGLHQSQRKDVKEKRNKTLTERIADTGKFFSHSAETIEKYRDNQNALYAKGKGKFQQTDFIEHNRKVVKEKLEIGQHHTQQEGWSEKARNAARKQMKYVVVAIRAVDGKTTERKFESLHEMQREIGADRRNASELSKKPHFSGTVSCDLGKVVAIVVNQEPYWNLDELSETPTSKFERKIALMVTIQLEDGSETERQYESIRGASRELEVDKNALRSILNKGKYKSAKCNIGRVINVREILD